MRAILHSDITAAARVLLAVPPPLRHVLCLRLMQEAHWADRYVKRTGKLHAEWGNGTLCAAAFAHPRADEPAAGTRDYACCLAIVLDHVIARSWSALE